MQKTGKVKAYIVLVLHAHLPYIRIPERRFPLQELWLFQAITECYIPIIKTLQTLIKENTFFNITISLSPTLISMLDDYYYKDKYRDYIKTLLKLIDLIEDRGDGIPTSTIAWLREKIEAVNRYHENINGDLLREFRMLSADERINIITSTATHAVLPLFRFNDDFIQRQIDAGLGVFEDSFGSRPRGIWLPEMGYHSGLDGILRDCDIEYTFLDAHSIYLSNSAMPSYGNFFPSITERGLTVYPREMALSSIIWSAHTGYPGDFRYREFHFDYTYSLPEKTLKEIGIEKMPFGLKIYRITGENDNKDFYDHGNAMTAVSSHCENFIDRTIERAEQIMEKIGRPPVFTLPFDAELFGHWWHEGPDFISMLIKKISGMDEIEMISPMALAGSPDLESTTPAESSWGDEGFFKVWLHPECTWLYPEIAGLYNRLENLREEKKEKRALEQALREIFLASSSDWVFFIANNSSKDYGNMRIRDHLDAAERIIDSVERGKIDEKFLQQRSSRYPIFGDINLF